MPTDLWAWLSLAGLGLFHGLNPAMGWLFAVALGLQEQRLSAVLAALPPIVLGHTAAIALTALLIAVLGIAIPTSILLTSTGAVLLLFTTWRIWRRFRHPRTRFRATKYELALWSFLMANAHGAGLMIAPLLIGLLNGGNAPLTTTGHTAHAEAFSHSLGVALAAVLVHSGALYVTMTVVAVIVYRELGLELLRRAWINVDL
ncbi:MAG: hypothetical protein ACK42I_03820, partial [Thermomicrobium sp.]